MWGYLILILIYVYADTTNNSVVIKPPSPSDFYEMTIIHVAGSNSLKIEGVVNDITDPTWDNMYGGFVIISDGTSMYSIENTPLESDINYIMDEDKVVITDEGGTIITDEDAA